MRIYQNFREALDETKRDLKEMGIRVHPQTMQDKDVHADPDYDTLELQNHAYVVTQPRLQDLEPTQPWANLEFAERVSGQLVNPGEAYKSRPEIWEEFLEKGDGHPSREKFSYTYAERFLHNGSKEWGDPQDIDGPSKWDDSTQLERLILNIKKYPDNRNHLLTVWDADDLWLVGEHRVPCSISYHFMYRDRSLFMTYQQRSADLATHLINDVYLAARLQQWVAEKLEWPVGRFTHFIGSLHAYQKDLEGVF